MFRLVSLIGDHRTLDISRGINNGCDERYADNVRAIDVRQRGFRMVLIPPPGLNPIDEPLFSAATQLLSARYVPGRHEVATAFRLSSGEIVLGLHVEGSCGRSSICAEGMALGASLLRTGTTVEAIVAVLFVASTGRIRLIAPCGVCRELLFDYCPEARCYTWTPGSVAPQLPNGNVAGPGFDLKVAEMADGEVKSWKIWELLPEKTKRVGW